uniref:Uncharacterized protein n=1 Tax=Siphoviridae sp. ctXWf36 TaxID=2825544 RepID=A0A8S5U2T3_9CAUD|nr:MAG TPA: hypothetical protein [Siphoviridae sp. ctXWf36]
METYLAHYGVLGMKWGVRRYQNQDGTLTEAGKKHSAKKTASVGRAGSYVKDVARGVSKSDKNTGKVIANIGDALERRSKEYSRYRDRDVAKKAKILSDDELKKAVMRMNLERQYRSLMKDDRDAGADFVYSKSKEAVKDVIAVTAPIVSAIVTPIIVSKITQKI